MPGRTILIERRFMLASLLLAGSALCHGSAVAHEGTGALRQRLVHLERRYGGRLGVAIRDTMGQKWFAYRGDERFPLCSTYKVLAAAFVLARVDRGVESLARQVVYQRSDLVPYSPVTGTHAGGRGLSVGALCDAAVTLSDNTAGSLLLDSFGGPAALTAYLRSLGDRVTRLDRREPALNEAEPDDPRDTTTPLAMLETLRTLVLADALSPSSRTQLMAWLAADRVGDERLRADTPKGWRIGDKTGSGARHATNDVAVLWPPGRAPIIVTAYYIDARASEDERNAVLAEIGHLAAAA